ncbi:MAG: 1-acyl-sn-glycerol-3-phosphate acyltransferase [Deltaproteobacteria bacterium]|nr:1-acyl-sn-glycerol-3-phosphate acyltransferase [Deltaproteobacteria bacterium]
MSIQTALQSWKKKIGEYYVNTLYPRRRFPFFWILDRLLSRVNIDDGSLEQIRNLGNEGIVVYTLKNKSQLNCLILRNLAGRTGIDQPEYCHGICMVLWQPFTNAFRALLSRIFHNPYKEGYLKKVTEEKKSSVIYLRGSDSIGSTFNKDPLAFLIDAAIQTEVPVYLVPILVTYGRQREKKDKGIGDILFGQSENPGAVKRILTFLRHSKQAFILAADPVDLRDYVEQHSKNSVDIMAYMLRRDLIERINAEKRTVVGPVLKSREEVIGMVLRDPALVAFMEDMAASGKKSYPDLVKEGRKDLLEIAANYSEIYIGLFDRALSWLWNSIFDGVVIDREGLARIREVARKMPFVVVPCHRSHIDYLLLSHVLYRNNIQQPFIAAGNNLLFWPMGHIFRKSGAFFLRRSFRGDPLYGQVFSTYIKVLLQEGFPLEFFIEGGRSRTGKMVMPKFGLLSMIIQAYREGACNDLAFVPVYIGYDRVVEETSYLKELGGGEKEPEKTSTLIKSRKVLKKRYGRIYMNVGEPIQMKAYLASQKVPIDDMSVEERQRLYRRMSYEIAHEINKHSVITPYSLVAAGLLCHFRRGVTNDELMNYIFEFIDYLDYRKVKFAATMDQRDKALAEALSQLEASGLIEKMGPDDEEDEEFEEVIYAIDEDKRLNLEYYKSNILHFFLPISFVATAILASENDEVSLYRIVDDFRFLKRLFRHEFIFDESVTDVEEVAQILDYFRNRGMIAGFEDGAGTWIEVKGKGRRDLVGFAGLVNNYIESYWITVRGCTYIREKARPEKDIVKKIQKLGTKMYKKGEISKPEALSRDTYRNALRFLTDAGIIEMSEPSGEKQPRLLSLDVDRSNFETLRRRLFTFMR